MPIELKEPDPQQMELRALMALGLMPEFSPNPKDLSQVTENLKIQNAMREMSKELPKDKCELLIKAIENIINYGHTYWHPWAVENWGTKWNAYDTYQDGNYCFFNTAWSHPEPIFLKLSKENPELEVKVVYADEDLGRNAEERIYKNGSLESQRELSFVECFELHYPGQDYKNHGYDEDGNYNEDLDVIENG